MANYIVKDTDLIAIADAIRDKTDFSGTMGIAEMPSKINEIGANSADNNNTVTLLNNTGSKITIGFNILENGESVKITYQGTFPGNHPFPLIHDGSLFGKIIFVKYTSNGINYQGSCLPFSIEGSTLTTGYGTMANINVGLTGFDYVNGDKIVDPGSTIELVAE